MGLKPLKQLHLLSSSRKREERSSVCKHCSKAEKSRYNYHGLVVTAAFLRDFYRVHTGKWQNSPIIEYGFYERWGTLLALRVAGNQKDV